MPTANHHGLLRSPFLHCSPPGLLQPRLSVSSSSFRKLSTGRRPAGSYPCVRALDLDQNTVVAISVGLVSVAVGIGIPVFYESQIDNAVSNPAFYVQFNDPNTNSHHTDTAKRENTQPCFPCSGSGAQRCRICKGTGSVTVELGGDEREVSRCINCDGVGTLTCTTCQGTGIQPRYLDRREFKDDD